MGTRYALQDPRAAAQAYLVQVISSGTLRAQFDQNSKVELLEFVTQDHKEFLPRGQMKALVSPHNSPDQKSSPKQTKTIGKQKAQQRAPPPAPIILPESQVNEYGVTNEVAKFLEVRDGSCPSSALADRTSL